MRIALRVLGRHNLHPLQVDVGRPTIRFHAQVMLTVFTNLPAFCHYSDSMMPSRAFQPDTPATAKHIFSTTKPTFGAVITVSDRCSRGAATDTSGPLAVRELAAHGVTCPVPIIVPDDVAAIRHAIGEAINAGARLVFTTGGTGVSPRDVTPEATEPLISLRLDGIAQQIRMAGLAATPMATLSRGLVGITERGESGVLIVNAPGSNGGVRDAVSVVGPIARHIIGQLAGRDHECHH